MQARYYDPVIGRFLSVDPVGFMDTGAPGMFNRYAYVENDPINMIDPFGLCGTGSNDGQTGSCGNNEDYTPPVPETSRDESELATGEAIDMSGALIEAVVSGGPGGFAVKGLGKAALKKGAAAAKRAKNIKKGIPEKMLGPSGKPKQHTKRHSTRKFANQSAKKTADQHGGRVRNDANPANSKQGPHFQAEDALGKNVKPVVHEEFPKR